MKTNEAMKVLASHRGEAIVVCALGTAANGWWAVTRSEDSFYMHGAMGFAASFALGLAVAIPTAPVWLLNSDGSLCMNLGCLLTEAGQQPSNLKHFVVDNQCYQTVSNMPMVNQNGADYAAIARGAGIARTLTIEDLAALDRQMPDINAAPGPYFIHLRVEAEQNYQRPPPFSYEGAEMKYRFGRALEGKFGIKVFGPTGF
ncbi:MAG TPA: thiamine pyrophosphate-dependent enzyme [Xanthobacteraceae bacterium]|nr:thiamine pyrophosphate-dependent enzyme [Xanthobacteraceae bacterium]